MRSPTWKRSLVALWFAVGLYQGCVHRPLEVALVGDDQLYFFVAERAASGVPPHLSLVDHKHQLAPLLSALTMRIGRAFGADDVGSGRVASLAAAAAMPPIVFALLEGLTGSVAAAAIGAASALAFRTYFFEAAIGYRPQLFMAVFAAAALLAFARKRHAAAGALAACSFLCWQPAGLVGAALVLAAAGDRDRRRAIVRTAVGGLAAVAVYEAYFLVHGALGEQLRQSYLLAGSRNVNLPPLAESLAFVISGNREALVFEPYQVAVAALLAGLAGCWVFALLRPRAALELWRRDAAWRALFLAAHGAIAFTLVDQDAYPDQFFILPFAAVAAGTLAWLGLQRLAGRGLRATLATAALLWVGAYAIDLPPRRGPRSPLSQQRVMAQRLARLADQHGGRLWVLGRLDLLALERRDNWSPFGMLLDARIRSYATERLGTGAIRPVRRGRNPSVILVSRIATWDHLDWIRREYDEAALEGFSRHDRLFVRKTKPQEARRAR